jgi:hypothetical protein
LPPTRRHELALTLGELATRDAGGREPAPHVLRGARRDPSGSPEGCPWLIIAAAFERSGPFRIRFTSRLVTRFRGTTSSATSRLTRRVLWLALLAVGLGVVSTLLAKGLLALIAVCTNLFFFLRSAPRRSRRPTRRSARGWRSCRSSAASSSA